MSGSGTPSINVESINNSQIFEMLKAMSLGIEQLQISNKSLRTSVDNIEETQSHILATQFEDRAVIESAISDIRVLKSSSPLFNPIAAPISASSVSQPTPQQKSGSDTSSADHTTGFTFSKLPKTNDRDSKRTTLYFNPNAPNSAKIDRNLNETFSSGSDHKSQQPTTRIVVANAPKFAHTLSEFSLQKLIDIKEEISLYTEEHNIIVPLSSVLSRELKDDLMAEYADTLTVPEFNRLSDDDIDTMLCARVLPKSKQLYLQYQKKAVKFPEMKDYFPTVKNFDKFVTAVTTYKIRFLLVHDYLSKSDKQYIPPLYRARKGASDNEKTQITMFLDSFPHKVGYLLHDLLIDSERPSSIHDYVSMFISNLKKQRALCHLLLPLADILTEWRVASGSVNAEASALCFLDDTSDSIAKENRELLHMSLNDAYEKKHPPDSKAACYTTVRGRVCRDFMCQYSHEPEDLETARDNIIAELQSVVYVPVQPVTRPSGTPATHKRPPPAVPHS